MTNLTKLPTSLKTLRKTNHFSQEYIANYLNLSRQAISSWETGKTIPDLQSLILLSQLYNISLDNLINDNIRETTDSTNMKHEFNNTASILKLICLFLSLFLSAQFPIISFIMPVFIAVWLYKTKTKNIFIIGITTIFFLIGIYNTYLFFTYLLPNNGTSSIEVVLRATFSAL